MYNTQLIFLAKHRAYVDLEKSQNKSMEMIESVKWSFDMHFVMRTKDNNSNPHSIDEKS